METVIRTEELTKRYGSKLAVFKVSLHIRKGDIYGLIGKNGAGKTTLMKMILGLTRPTSGSIVLPDEKRKPGMKIGSLIETPGLYKNETALENMRRFAILAPTTEERMKELLEMVGLGDVGNKKAGAFSLGMRQRLGIAVALLGDPEVLILDEPVNGLDPAGIREVRDLILRLNRQGVTILISSHLLDELGKVANCFGIMDNGLLVEEITAEELEEKCKKDLQITVDRTEDACQILRKEWPEIQMVKTDGKIEISSGLNAWEVNRVLVLAGIRVYEMKNGKRNFEDYYFERVGF